MRRLCACVVAGLILFSIHGLRAQESATQETNPPSLKWYQINTDHFRLLYPLGFEAQAQRMANTLEQIREPEAASMGVKPKKISIILQNQSSISNGFVALAPRRSEFYAMPTQDYNFVGNNDWLNLLASHEYRHIVQYQRSITGFNKIFYYLLGQQALSGMANAAAPLWFWEGDAVATETAFTHSGRGRIPNFSLLMRTNLLEGRVFNYHKQYLGSYKHNIPNYYVLGYHMVSYLRTKTGDANVWERIAHRSWNVPFIPFAFSNSIKRESGLYVTKLYREMAASRVTQWRKELEGLTLTPFERVTTRNSKAYTDYKFPQVLQDESIVTQKSGIGDIEQLVVTCDGIETAKYVQGQINSAGMLSAAQYSVVWNEFRYDPRWLIRNYSVIKRYDFKTGKSTIISGNSRFASAALSPDAERIATIETGTDYQTKLVILDGQTGTRLLDFPNPENYFISMPRWDSDGKSVVALKTNKDGKSLMRFILETRASIDLLPPSDENIGYPVPFGKYVLYNSPYSGIDNIYALDTENGKRYQVTCSKYGAYNPVMSKDGKFIYYNDQARDGLDVVKAPLDPGKWRPLEQVSIPQETTPQRLAAQEGHPGLLDQVPAKKFPAQRYHRASGMINPHSWGTYFTNSYTQAQFGIYSQDILSTTSINAGYLYDINERTGSFQAGISYQGFYPIIDFQIQQGNRQVKTSVFDRDVQFNWRETGTSVGLRVPLLLTRSKYIRQVEIGNTVGLTSISGFQNTVTQGGVIVFQGNSRFVPANDTLLYGFTDRVANGQLISNFLSFTFSNSLKQSRRDFNPKFGQFLTYENYNTPYGGDYNGRLSVIRGLLFFPGIFKHHSLYFRGGYQTSLISTSSNIYAFRNRVYKPRGYSYPNENKFFGISGNYSLPIWYPDIAVGPLLNIQRIKVNLFSDYGYGEGKAYFYRASSPDIYYINHGTQYQSSGIEMTFDINVMRLLQQFELGFRLTQIQKANSFNKSGVIFEFLIGNIPF